MPGEQAEEEEEVRSLGEHDPWAQAAGIASNSAPASVGRPRSEGCPATPPPQGAEARAARSAPGRLDVGRGPSFDGFQIGTPERRRSEDEGFSGLSPVRGTGQGTSDQQQQQPWAEYQNTGWPGPIPVQPGSWSPQGGQGTAAPLPQHQGTHCPGGQQQPTALEAFLQSQAKLHQQLAAVMTRPGPPVTVLAGIDDTLNSAAAEQGASAKELQSALKYKINSGKPPSFANRDSEDVEGFWRDWRRFLSNNYSGAGVSARNQMELLRTYLEGDVRTDFLDIVDSLDPLEEEDYGVDFGDVQLKLQQGLHDEILQKYMHWSLENYAKTNDGRKARALRGFDDLHFKGKSFQAFQAEWRKVLADLRKAGIHKDKGELVTGYLTRLPDACSDWIQLKDARPATHLEASKMSKRFFDSVQAQKVTTSNALALEEILAFDSETCAGCGAPFVGTGGCGDEEIQVSYQGQAYHLQCVRRTNAEEANTADAVARGPKGPASAASGRSRGPPGYPRLCTSCHGVGHKEHDCPSQCLTAEERSTFTTANRTKGQACGVCQATDHRAGEHEKLQSNRLAEAIRNVQVPGSGDNLAFSSPTRAKGVRAAERRARSESVAPAGSSRRVALAVKVPTAGFSRRNHQAAPVPARLRRLPHRLARSLFARLRLA